MTSLLINATSLHIPLANNSVQAVITSPPYWGLRSYGIGTENGELGLERVPDCLGWATGNPCGVCYVCHMVQVFREVRRVMRDDGILWLNLGDSYNTQPAGNKTPSGISQISNKRNGKLHEYNTQPKDFGNLKPKDLIGIPWRVALALQADGWYLRSDVIWAKPNPMPESVTDRPTKSHEYIFLMTKSARYFWDQEAVKEEQIGEPHAPGNKTDNGRLTSSMGHFEEPGRVWASNGKRNIRTVWTIATQPTKEAHFATFPEALAERCIKAGTSERGCCPKCGKPWERVVERTAMVIERSDRTHELGRTRSSGTMVEPASSVTTGFAPACTCPAADPIPCVVLDPFVGSGTVARVAIRLNRRPIGLDLSMKYLAEIATKRTDELQPIMF